MIEICYGPGLVMFKLEFTYWLGLVELLEQGYADCSLFLSGLQEFGWIALFGLSLRQESAECTWS